MDELRFIKKLPPMLAGKRLEDALTIMPDYDPEIVYAGWLAGVVHSNPIYEQMAQLTFFGQLSHFSFFSNQSISSFSAFTIRSFSP